MKKQLHFVSALSILIFVGGLFSARPLLAQELLPAPDHIVVVIMENKAYTDIIGSSAAPYINALANDPYSALFTQSYAIEHPSQPNYLDLYSGCNQGVTDDGVPSNRPFTTPNMGRQLLDAGKTYATYSEGLPSVGFSGYASGNYASKHNPASNWMGTGVNQIPITTNQPFTAFPTDFNLLPTVSYVIPNQNNDMHNGIDPFRITKADNWLKNNLNDYIEWAKTNNSLLIFTFDEDDDKHKNRILTFFTGQMVKGGQYADSINHYFVLRTIEDMYGLPYACNAATAGTIDYCWMSPDAIHTNKSVVGMLSVYPNPSNGTFTITLDNASAGQLQRVEISNMIGENIYTEKLSGSSTAELNLKDVPPGIYILKVFAGKKSYTQKLTIR